MLQSFHNTFNSEITWLFVILLTLVRYKMPILKVCPLLKQFTSLPIPESFHVFIHSFHIFISCLYSQVTLVKISLISSHKCKSSLPYLILGVLSELYRANLTQFCYSKKVGSKLSVAKYLLCHFSWHSVASSWL